jgi:lysophospholipid acyltransferase (LPLAT)-like uncharacterized protein
MGFCQGHSMGAYSNPLHLRFGLINLNTMVNQDMNSLMNRLNNWFYDRILPGLGWMAMMTMHSTLRIRVVGEDRVKALRVRDERLIYAFWHGRFYMLLRYLAGQKVCAMASVSRDGKLIADIIRRMDYKIAEGSSSRSALRALAASIRLIQTGYDLLITVDGPKGPAGVVKPGALYLAQKTDAWIVPYTFTGTQYITFHSWDRYRLPLPFSRVLLVFGEPIKLHVGLDEAELNAECEKLAVRLRILDDHAEEILNR